MSDRESKGFLLQRWFHSREEDTETEQVFRPADYDFPPSRGRDGFQFEPDGTLLQISPGPSDRPQAKKGTWELAEGDILILSCDVPPRENLFMKIVALGEDKLVLQKKTS